MARNRSSSNASTSTSLSPALISRGFASFRRVHRRLSLSSPTSPSTSTEVTGAMNVSATEDPMAHTPSDRHNSESTGANLHPHIRLIPNVGLSNRSFVFEIIDRQLEPGVIYRIGRFSDRNITPEKLSFKSKVISRNHAELWTEGGKVYIRDIGSSSGTFLNRIRLSAPNHTSQAQEIKDGDTLQLGVGYQGGIEPIYRAVRIRIEINRQEQNMNSSAYTRSAFQNLCNNLIRPDPSIMSPDMADTDLCLHREITKIHEPNEIAPDSPKQQSLIAMMAKNTHITKADIQECCICLYAIAPFQALFIAPCSHMFHFKCLRPIVFQNYPGFSCPLCRSYFDLEASVAVEVDDILEAINETKEQRKKDMVSADLHKDSQSSPINITPTGPSHHSHSELGAIEEELPNVETRIEGMAKISLPAVITDNQTDDTIPLPQLIDSLSTQTIDTNNDSQLLLPDTQNNISGNSEALLSTTLVESPALFENIADSLNSTASS
ncbi:hypothetical protein BDB01DRAFT_778931 [Pilobolus umbonatus]|nr:hypothetical protein BDB01DRAFT_778931 [Pilobolus umbonatus]